MYAFKKNFTEPYIKIRKSDSNKIEIQYSGDHKECTPEEKNFWKNLMLRLKPSIDQYLKIGLLR